MNPHTDRRPPDSPVTQETIYMNTLTRLLARMRSLTGKTADLQDTRPNARGRKSGRNNSGHLAAGGAAATERDHWWSSAPGSKSRGSHEGRGRQTLGSDVSRPRSLRSAAFILSAVAVLVVVAAEASPAAAASPWWHLQSGSRPSYIRPGSAADASTELSVSATTGTFTLSFLGEATAPLAFNATAAAIQSALQGLSSIGPGNVDVSGGPAATAPLTITFTGHLSDLSLPAIKANSSNLNGGSKEARLTPLVAGSSDGEIVLTAENLGNADAGSPQSPVQIKDVLPPGLEAIGIAATKPHKEGDFQAREPLTCNLAALTCTLQELLHPFDALEMRIAVNLRGAESGEMNRVSISGGGAKAAALERPTVVSGEPVPFAVDEYEMALEEEGGGPLTHAAAHPFQFTTQVNLNQGRDTYPLNYPEGEFRPEVVPVGLAKNVAFNLPPGLIGNPSGLTKCTVAQFFTTQNGGNENLCPASSAVGVISTTVQEPATVGTITIPEPLFNMESEYGEPARFGFYVLIANTPVFIDTSVRSGNGGDYGITASVDNITQTAAFLSSTATFWGVPGASSHDGQRGWGCLLQAREFGVAAAPCLPSEELHPPVLFSSPTSCSAPLSTSVGLTSWADRILRTYPGTFRPAGDLLGCNQVPFAPTIEAEPTSDAATSPTGLNFAINVDDDGLQNPQGFVQSQIKKAVITLPQGFTTNPSVAEGLHSCSQGAYEASTVEAGTGCPEDSKIGDVEIESPLIEGKKVLGSLFVAKQGENPNGNNLLTIYMVAKNPELGVMIRQALKVVPNPVTGQLTTEVDNVPQLPFSRFYLSFRQGQRSPLVTPPTCGAYTVTAALYPYSEPDTPRIDESTFEITQGSEGQPCPSGTPRFHPGLEAGTINNAAGTYSPFYTHITRKDSEQEITRFSIKLPTGLIAKLAGVSECSDAAIALAKSREVEGGGAIEEAHPSCPSNSEVGHTLVGSGVGNVLAYAPGKLYLAGPYHGSPISLVSITAAKVGPFDLGTVVVRFALDVNHETAEVSVDGANSDPIPHIVDGIPIHLRDLRAYVSRPNFTLNPTSCAKKSTAATILGSGLNFVSSSDDVPVTVSSPFQAADCASLGFAPKLALSLTGKKTHRGALPAFKAVLTYPKGGGYANIAKAQVTLPESEYLEQGHLKDVCTRKVFETGATPGENCPASSIYGKARAVTPLLEAPLEGPVYLRTGYGTKLPELAAALNGRQISITLAGKIDSVHQKGSEGSRIRNTFEAVPDAPVERFTLELKGGKKGLLVNSTDVCKGTHKALAAFTGQNGKLDEYEPALKAQCGKSGGKKKSKGGKKKGAK
jgi:hypothetical protein